MYYDKFYPFHLAYASPALFDGERVQEKEFSLLKSYYPDMAKRIQEKVEAECELMDYEGSRLYDEYPDPLMLRQFCSRIRRELEPEIQSQEVSDRFLGELIEVLVYQEISRRRCRRHRCRRYF